MEFKKQKKHFRTKETEIANSSSQDLPKLKEKKFKQASKNATPQSITPKSKKKEKKEFKIECKNNRNP